MKQNSKRGERAIASVRRNKPLHVAYIINQYPKVSHTFIRREILALERLGVTVQRISIRGWNDDIADPQDKAEREQTYYVLRGGVGGLLIGVFRCAFRRPARFLSALGLALKMSRRSERPLLYHLAYLAEACIVVRAVALSGATHMHAHFGTNSTEVAMLSGVMSGMPYSFTAHGSSETDSPKAIGLPEKTRRAAFVIAVCSYIRSQLLRWVEHEHWHKIRVVRCGLEPEFFALGTAQPDERNSLVCVGRLSAEKGQLILLEALQAVISQGYDCKLTLVGDGPMRPVIEAKIDEWALRSHVRITGWVSSTEVRNEILKSRALVVPSFTEGLPIVLMEAMSLGKPVLATHITGIPELVEHGRSGWLFPPGDSAAMSRAITACFEAEPATLACMGEQGRACVIEKHDIDNSAKSLAALFEGGTAAAGVVE
jgi:glycosyltransferase involved in cell wall biosynthesis